MVRVTIMLSRWTFAGYQERPEMVRVTIMLSRWALRVTLSPNKEGATVANDTFSVLFIVPVVPAGTLRQIKSFFHQVLADEEVDN